MRHAGSDNVRTADAFQQQSRFAGSRLRIQRAIVRDREYDRPPPVTLLASRSRRAGRRYQAERGGRLHTSRERDVRIFLLIAVLLLIAGCLVIVRRNRAKRRAAELRAARLRAMRKPSVPFVSASLRGVTTQDPARPTTTQTATLQPTTGSDRAA